MTKEVLVIGITLIPLCAFIYQSIRESSRADSLLRFFQFGEDLPKSSFFATLAASNSGLSASVYLITVYGYFYGLGVLPWIVGFWISTQFASRWVIRRVEQRNASSGGFIARHGTLHEFLGEVFQSSSIRIVAGTLSALAYLGIVACELLLGYEVVSALMPETALFGITRLETGAFVVTLSIFTLVAFYARAAGFRAVIRTDKLQVALILAMLASVCLLLVFLGPELHMHYSAVFPAWSSKALFDPDGQGVASFFVFFVGMNIIFWALWWPAAMDQWHRCAASQQVDTVLDKRYGTLGWISISYFTLLSFACLLMGATLRVLVKPSGGESAPLMYFLRYLGETPLVPEWIAALFIGLICAGLLAAVVSTIDSYLIVAVQSVVVDVRLALESGDTVLSADRNPKLGVRYLMRARQCVSLFFILSIVLALILSCLSDVFAAIYWFFSFMLAAVPAIVIGVCSANPTRYREGVLYGLIVSGVWAIFTNAYIVLALERALEVGDPQAISLYYNLLYTNPTLTAVVSLLVCALYEVACVLSARVRPALNDSISEYIQ